MRSHLLFISLFTLSILQSLLVYFQENVGVALSNKCPLCPARYGSDGTAPRSVKTEKSLRRSLRKHIAQHFVLRLCGCQKLVASDDSLGRHHRQRCDLTKVWRETGSVGHVETLPYIICDRENYSAASLYVQTRTGCTPLANCGFPAQTDFPHQLITMPNNNNRVSDKPSPTEPVSGGGTCTRLSRRKRSRLVNYAEDDDTRDTEVSVSRVSSSRLRLTRTSPRPAATQTLTSTTDNPADFTDILISLSPDLTTRTTTTDTAIQQPRIILAPLTETVIRQHTSDLPNTSTHNTVLRTDSTTDCSNTSDLSTDYSEISPPAPDTLSSLPAPISIRVSSTTSSSTQRVSAGEEITGVDGNSGMVESGVSGIPTEVTIAELRLRHAEDLASYRKSLVDVSAARLQLAEAREKAARK